jgi:hypothetical protein
LSELRISCTTTLRDEVLGHLDIVDVDDVSADFVVSHPARIRRDDLVVETVPIGLTLRDDGRLELDSRSRRTLTPTLSNSVELRARRRFDQSLEH